MPAAAARVAAVPYDVVNTDEARTLAADNPLSFLHVSRAEIDLPTGTSPFVDEVYERAAANFARLRDQAPLVREDAPSVYLYRLRAAGHEQTGVAAGFSVEEYDRGSILKHEHTRPEKEDDRTRHILALRAQTGPVFLTYRAQAVIDALVAGVTKTAMPLFDFTAGDGVQHTIWRTDDPAARQLHESFGTVPALYIADGHHRAASAARARRELRGEGQAGPWDWFLAVAFPHDQLRILPYNRVVADLAGMTPDAFLRALAARFTLRDGPATPTRKGQVAVFLGDVWKTIVFGPPSAGSAPADRLDVTRLEAGVLAPLLRIGDMRTDSRIDFVGGSRGTAELEARVRAGASAAAFSFYPVSIDDLMTISDAGGMMPPKSTWFEPKLRDGLLTHLI